MRTLSLLHYFLALFVKHKSAICPRLPAHLINPRWFILQCKALCCCDISFTYVMHFHHVHTSYGHVYLLSLFSLHFPWQCLLYFVISTLPLDSHLRRKRKKATIPVFLCLFFSSLRIIISYRIHSLECKMIYLFVHE